MMVQSSILKLFASRIECCTSPLLICSKKIVLVQYSVYGRCPDRQVHTGAAQREMSDELAAPLNTGIVSAVRARDVELAVVNAELSQSDTSRIRIISEPCKERFLVFFFAISLLVPSIIIVFVVANEWMSSPSQRGWLILGFGFYIMTAMRLLWSYFIQVYEKMRYVKVEVRRLVCPTLFDAITHDIAKKAEEQGQTCSRSCETVQTHHEVTGNFEVQLRFWSSEARTVHLQINAGTETMQVNESYWQRQNNFVTVKVQYYPGEDIVTGRDSRVQRREMMVFTVKTSAQKAPGVKKVLQHWFEDCYNKWVQPDASIVKVFALQETSSDWVQTWECARNKSFKTKTGSGHAFYLERDCSQKVLADACLWSNSTLRIYMVIGPAGVGKSEFTIWLAGQMKLPVYRLCLSNPRLTDDRLAQLLSQSAITYNSVLIQVDEFQQMVTRWMRSASSDANNSEASGVTAGGFCECLQGSTAMGRGIVVLSGTTEIITQEAWSLLEAVFRRVSFQVTLGYMSAKDVQTFLHRFLVPFLPDCTDEEWAKVKTNFTSKDSFWNETQNISVDKLKQFLMHEITEAHSSGLGFFRPNNDNARGDFNIFPHCRATFLKRICNAERATRFMDQYARLRE